MGYKIRGGKMVRRGVTTVREHLAIYSNLDAYIAKGGQLLDLNLHDWEDVPDAVTTFIAEQLGAELMNRLGRFFSRVAEAMSDEDALVGDVLKEEQMRAIWRETALPRSDRASGKGLRRVGRLNS
jgi:hypothetical protein